MTTKLDTGLAALREGEIDWTAFWEDTRKEWEALAGSLVKRWGNDVPSVDVDDVMQDLVVAAWDKLSQWDPSRGPTLKTYVVWQAMSTAKKSLHKARGANMHRPDRSPPRAPIASSEAVDMRGSEPNQQVADRLHDALALAGPNADIVQALLDGDPKRAVALVRERDSSSHREATAEVRQIAQGVLDAL